VGEGAGEPAGRAAGDPGPPGAAAVVGCPAEPALPLPLLLPHPPTASTAAASTAVPASGRPVRNTNSSVLYTVGTAQMTRGQAVCRSVSHAAG